VRTGEIGTAINANEFDRQRATTAHGTWLYDYDSSPHTLYRTMEANSS